MGVCVRLGDVSAYGRLRMWSFSTEIAETIVLSPLVGGVHLREVSVSGGSTICHQIIILYYYNISCL